MNGVLLVAKPPNYTSRDIVNVISKKFNQKKVGHTGTLDPLATGVLVVCLGKYTKLVNLLTSLDKEYIATIKLGIKTDTLDITGSILEENSKRPQLAEIKEVFNSFIGEYKMEVPLYSAVKVNGQKLYEYARQNKKVILPIKNVNIFELELLNFDGDNIKFRAKVSKGTYIRSLINDICTKLNVLGTMSSLVRTKQGSFILQNAYSLTDIQNNNYQILKVKDILDIPEYKLNDKSYLKVKNGHKIQINSTANLILLTYDKEVAIYQKENDIYKPYVMLI